jgi:20S proteasome alpha/beta subunit
MNYGVITTGVVIFSSTFSYRYHVDPSGTYIRFEAKAIGAGSEGAQVSIREGYNKV